jgi:PAS domain S-box-containing protein
MAQFIYQMHGLFEMHFFAFIGSAILITYQKWRLQIPVLVVVVIHHASLGYLQNIGVPNIYFTQLDYFPLQTFIIHVLLAALIFFICGLWAYQLKKYNEIQISQAVQMTELQKEAQLSIERKRSAEALEERNIILESITDAFIAVDNNWVVTYWNNMAEKVLRKPKNETLGQNLWDVYADSTDSKSYHQCHSAMETRQSVHFEDYYPVLEKWYEISAYPSDNGLSFYFKDITERKLSEIRIKESEKKYSELFHLSPLPMWVFDVDSSQFLDVNIAAIKHYGYSRAEFLSMTIKDIRPVEDIYLLKESLVRYKAQPQFSRQGIFRHKKKNGEIIQVDIQSRNIQFKGKKGMVILANDITESLNYIKAIEAQNEKLKEISWMQSHVIRAPLARIKALIPLIGDVKEDIVERDKMLDYLSLSANELDDVIGNITDMTSIVDYK